MMRTPKQVIQLLKEKLTPNLQKKVGNVLFGSLNTIAKLQKAKIPVDGSEAELNTAWENDLYAKIESWIEVSEVSVAKFFAKNKELLQTLAKDFPSVLQPPIGKLAYRGTSIKIDSLKNAFIKKQYEIVKVGGREAFHFKNLGYIPNRESQSWTIDPKVAFKFEGRANNEDSVRVVYAIRVNKDFIFSPELMNIIYTGIGQESETVRIGGEGIFEAFVDSSVFLNTWKFEPKAFFTHKISKAKPFFKPMIDKYNKAAAKDNKRFPVSERERISPVSSIEDIITAYDNTDDGPIDFNFRKEYGKSTRQFINLIKNK